MVNILLEKKLYEKVEEIARRGGINSLLILDSKEDDPCTLEELADTNNFQDVFISAIWCL